MNMNLKKFSVLPLLIGLTMAANIANADESTQGARGQNMSPDQKEAMKQKWENMTPEQQAAYKAKREQRKEQWQNMTPEEQQAYKAKREQRKQQWQKHVARRTASSKRQTQRVKITGIHMHMNLNKYH